MSSSARAQRTEPAPAAPTRAGTPDILVTAARDDALRTHDLSTAATRDVSGLELDEAKAPSLGATLARLPGVQNGYFGPGAGRPEIRGLSGNRVAMLVDGLPVQDASGTTGDHAAPVEPFLVDRITVLKGPAALLYGGSAIGGAIDVADGRIPTVRPDRPTGGRAEIAAGDNAGATALARLDGGHGRLAWHLDGLYRYAGDFAIPSEQKADACRSWSGLVSNAVLQATCQVKLARPVYQRDPATGRYVDATPPAGQIITDLAPGRDGVLANSAIRTSAVNAGVSLIGSAGYIGAAFGRYDSAYGVPGFGYITATHPVPSPVRLRVGQSRLDVRAALARPLPGIALVTLRAARTRGVDREIIDGRDASTMRIAANTVRLELAQATLGPWTGVLGGEGSDTRLRTAGDDAYLPGVASHERSLFAIEQLALAPFTLRAGVRHDWIDRDLDETTLRKGRGLGRAYARDRRFQLWNYAGSARLDLTKWLHLDGRYAHAERAPAVNELYANGNHFAIVTEEQGDGRLKAERAETIEGGGGIDARWFSLSASAYRTRYRDFIYLGNTGISRTLRVFEWRQADSRFSGLEGEASLHLPDFGLGRFTLHGVGDKILGRPVIDLPTGYSPFAPGSTPAYDAQYFRQKLDGDNLPRVPASRYGGDLAWSAGGWRAAAGLIHYVRQERVARNEAVSPGYTLADAHLGYGWADRGRRWEAFADVTNLTDAEARPYNSYLRYRAPLPGRAIVAGLRTAF